MSAIYDNWERLVAATLKRDQLWQLFHAQSRSPSILSEASDFSTDPNSSFHDEDPLWQKDPPKLVLLSDFSPSFDIEDLHGASAVFLGKGTFGAVYLAELDNGVRIVVKRLKSGHLSGLDFKHHMSVIGNVRHGNVAPIRAYYATDNERILLYDYYSEGSVYALLHGQNGTQVSWEMRRTIAIGAARGISEIHKKDGRRLVHGNITTWNVFISGQLHCCVADLGLASMIETKFIPSAECYAPEVKTSKDVSQASDVYSFGILLLELLTRKSSVNVPGGPKATDLVKLVKSIRSKQKAAKVIDADLLQHRTMRDDVFGMLQIGIKCVTKSMKKRPKMSEVVKMLEDLFKANPLNQVPAREKLVFVGDVSLPLDLEDVLQASAEVLGKGTFGTSYKARMEIGNTIMVKRLKAKDVVITFEAFRQHMEVFGNMNHENVADIMAYYFSRDEKLVIQRYYHGASVHVLLHNVPGMRESSKVVLDWRTRLKIATGAVRGIAHIHRQDDGKLVHGNFKSSNIFVDEQYYGIVADAGLAKLYNPVKLSMRQDAGYHAPELRDTWQASQASDVYSVGVFMLELASRLPMLHKTDDSKPILLVKWFKSLLRDTWIAKVVDSELLTLDGGEEEGMLQFLHIAMVCVDSDPRRRPQMPQVVKMLEDISGLAVSDESRVEDASEYDALQPTFASRLEDLVEDLLPTLVA